MSATNWQASEGLYGIGGSYRSPTGPKASHVPRAQSGRSLSAFFDGSEMLAAWCEMRDAFRHFRMDRIEVLTVLEDNIPRSGASLLTEYRSVEPDANV